MAHNTTADAEQYFPPFGFVAIECGVNARADVCGMLDMSHVTFYLSDWISLNDTIDVKRVVAFFRNVWLFETYDASKHIRHGMSCAIKHKFSSQSVAV